MSFFGKIYYLFNKNCILWSSDTIYGLVWLQIFNSSMQLLTKLIIHDQGYNSGKKNKEMDMVILCKMNFGSQLVPASTYECVYVNSIYYVLVYMSDLFRYKMFLQLPILQNLQCNMIDRNCKNFILKIFFAKVFLNYSCTCI